MYQALPKDVAGGTEAVLPHPPCQAFPPSPSPRGLYTRARSRPGAGSSAGAITYMACWVSAIWASRALCIRHCRRMWQVAQRQSYPTPHSSSSLHARAQTEGRECGEALASTVAGSSGRVGLGEGHAPLPRPPFLRLPAVKRLFHTPTTLLLQPPKIPFLSSCSLYLFLDPAPPPPMWEDYQRDPNVPFTHPPPPPTSHAIPPHPNPSKPKPTHPLRWMLVQAVACQSARAARDHCGGARRL